MAKAVFRPGELIALSRKVVLDAPTSFPGLAHQAEAEEAEEALVEVEEYSGPTADDLRREAEAFKAQWDTEREVMLMAAQTEAELIVQKAQEAAEAETRQKIAEGEVLKAQAEEEAERIIAEAKENAAAAEAETRKNLDEERKQALDEGREAGRAEGYAEGKAEVDRLIRRTQTVLERAQDKRVEILADTEQEIIDLVLLIARKVIKVISDNQRGVIVSNVVQALRKVKGRGSIIIRVNIADLKLATEHTKDFIQMLEGAASVQVVEDSSVDSGGCIIETDFGEIDARIASQLAELESKILEISPIKSNIRTDAPAAAPGNAAAKAAAAQTAAARSAIAARAAPGAAQQAAPPANGT
jgi:flagellar assembly protein FliH